MGDSEIADQFTMAGIRELFIRIYDHLDQLPAPAYVRWLDEIIANLGAEPEGDFSTDHRELSRKKPK